MSGNSSLSVKDPPTHPTKSPWGLDVCTLMVWSAFGRTDPRKRLMKALEIGFKPFDMRDRERGYNSTWYIVSTIEILAMINPLIKRHASCVQMRQTPTPKKRHRGYWLPMHRIQHILVRISFWAVETQSSSPNLLSCHVWIQTIFFKVAEHHIVSKFLICW